MGKKRFKKLNPAAGDDGETDENPQGMLAGVNTKTLLIGAGVLLVGYLIWKRSRAAKAAPAAPQPLPAPQPVPVYQQPAAPPPAAARPQSGPPLTGEPTGGDDMGWDFS